MKIAYINTQNKTVAKDMLVRKAIEAGLQYIEMEDEVLIEGNYLFRIVEKELICVSAFPILLTVSESKQFFEINDEMISIDDSMSSSFSKFKKNDFKREAKRVNSLVKTKQYSNIRRRYK